jgi:hypothetical protein
MIDLLYFRSVVEAATLVIHGLNETTELASGPPLPTACTTETPALVARSSCVSSKFRKDEGPDETEEGAMERLITSTPSSTAYKQVTRTGSLAYRLNVLEVFCKQYDQRTWSTAAITSDMYPPKG